MIRNYLKLAWRTMLKKKMHFAVVITGLAMAYTACILIYLHVRDELSYDRFNNNHQLVYRVVKDFVNDDVVLPDATTPPALAPAMLEEIPEIEYAARLFPNWGNEFLVRQGDKVFYEELRYRADSNFLKVFTFKFLEGDAATALDKDNNVILTKRMADKYFDGQPALGKSIEIGEGQNRLKVVTGVIENIPDNSHFHFDFLIPPPANVSELNSNWRTYNWYTYIQLKPGADIAGVEKKIVDLYKRHDPKGINRYYTQALTDIHLKSNLKWELEPNGNISLVKIFVTVGVFILVMACINYINLSIALAFGRSKEVGIRKVSGAHVVGLTNQFMIESVLTSVLAVIVAIALVEALLPMVNLQFGKNLVSLTQQPLLLVGIVGAAILVGIISSTYPALYLSAFKPVQVLKGIYQQNDKNIWLRKGLVIFQFSISIALIVGTIVVIRQVNYLKSKDLGFNKDQVVVIENILNVRDKQAVKNRLVQVHQIASVGGSNGILGRQNMTTGMTAKGSTNAAIVNFTMVDYDYLDVLGVQFKSGRNFSRSFPSDTVDAVILNETALQDLGIHGDPIGALITMDANADTVKYSTIIGVVKDFHFASLKNEIKPYMFILNERASSNFLVKISSRNLKNTLKELESAWASVVSDRPFEYFFLDESFQAQYTSDENFRIVFSVLTVMAMYIACSGLFAIASFFISRRTKEIGIRKVMGASVKQITWLVSAEFIFVVIVANFIAWPAAYYFMNTWLSGFAYRVSVNGFSFLAAALIAVIIALLTVGFQSIKAAIANPVDSLRSE